MPKMDKHKSNLSHKFKRSIIRNRQNIFSCSHRNTHTHSHTHTPAHTHARTHSHTHTHFVTFIHLYTTAGCLLLTAPSKSLFWVHAVIGVGLPRPTRHPKSQPLQVPMVPVTSVGVIENLDYTYLS
jgi:hypothetical protein